MRFFPMPPTSNLLTTTILALCLGLAGCGLGSSSSGGNDDTTPTAEGSVSEPVMLTVGVADSGFAGAGESSYYVVNHGNAIHVTVDMISANVDLSIFESADFATGDVGCANQSGTTTEGCTDPSGAGTYYILVEDMAGSATTYRLTVTDAS